MLTQLKWHTGGGPTETRWGLDHFKVQQKSYFHRPTWFVDIGKACNFLNDFISVVNKSIE